MKAIIINTVCGEGSTGKLSLSLVNKLVECGNSAIVIYGAGNLCEAPNTIKISSKCEQKIHNLLGRITGLNCCFSWWNTHKILKRISEFNPDVIYFGNLHGHYVDIFQLYRFVKKKRIPCVQIMWDEYPMTGSCTFSYDCEKFMGKCSACEHKKDYPISLFFDTSGLLQKKKNKVYDNPLLSFVGVPYTANRARESFLLKGKKIYDLDEAVDQKNRYFPRDARELKKQLGIPENNKIILNVCVYPGKRKGGKYYLELARKCQDLENITFVHVGFNGDTSICPSNYIPIGFIRDQDMMPFYYSLGDLFVCTSLAETQPNTCLEALSCGTPICGFNISGIPTCADEPFGKYVPFEDLDSMKKIIIDIPRKPEKIILETRKYAESRFSSEDYNRRLMEIGLEMSSKAKEIKK